MAKLSAKVPSLGAIRTSPCTSWDTPPSGGRTSRMRSVSETAKTPSLIPSVRSVRYLRPVLSLSSFDEPSPLMRFSRQLPFHPAGPPTYPPPDQHQRRLPSPSTEPLPVSPRSQGVLSGKAAGTC